MEIFDIIKSEHVEQREMMAQLLDTQGDSDTRNELFKKFCREYKAHAAAEEQIFYAELMTDPDGTDTARHGVAEHKTALDMVKELEQTDMSSPGWLVTFKKLDHENRHHMEEEEQDVFPHASKVLSEESLTKMADLYVQRKQAEKEA